MRGDTPEFSDETLLGYLLGGLTDAENLAIESALTESGPLRIRLSDLRGLLEPLAEMDEPFEPRADLLAETMSLIVRSEDFRTSNEALKNPPCVRLALRPIEWSEAPIATRLAWLDSIVAIAAGILFLSFLLPSVWQWRESARRIGCSENLRNMSAALFSFADFSSARRLPSIDLTGSKAFAGMYAIQLRDLGLLDSVRWLQCPSSVSLPFPCTIPTSEQFLSASEEQQEIWRRLAGGNYAYHLGSVIDGEYCTPTVDAPPVRFAILGDIWPSSLGGPDAAKPIDGVHGDRAANILYSDRGIRLIRIPDQNDPVSIDHPFLNRELQQAAGIGLEDTCLGPSHCLPAASLFRPTGTR